MRTMKVVNPISIVKKMNRVRSKASATICHLTSSSSSVDVCDSVIDIFLSTLSFVVGLFGDCTLTISKSADPEELTWMSLLLAFPGDLKY